MKRDGKFVRMAITLLVGFPMSLGPLAVRAAWAQTAPACPPGYYYASDGYCYPGQQPPTYAYAPPVYDATPPVYQPPPVIDGVAIGVGLGLLFGALASSGDHDRDRGHAPPPRRPPPPHRYDERGHR
ncbi:MAG: hypothetical protein ACREFL_21920 [Stellaceae bacterium]